MDKYIGFDIDRKKTAVCVVQNGKKDMCPAIGPDIGSMRRRLEQARLGGCHPLDF